MEPAIKSGDREAKVALWRAVEEIVLHGVGFESRETAMQMELARLMCGAGCVIAEMNRKGSGDVRGLAFDPAARIDEVYGLAA